MPAGQGMRDVRLATSGQGDAHAALAAFRLTPEPAILVTVAMAYEGLDAPEVAVVAALTHIRSRPWLEQMLARATRSIPMPAPTTPSRRWSSTPTTRSSPGSAWNWRPSRAAASGPGGSGRSARSCPSGPGGATRTTRRDHAAGEQRDRPALRPVASAPRRARPGSAGSRTALGHRANATPTARDGGRRPGGGGRGLPAGARGGNLAHRYNAVLKRVLGKGRATMTLPELEAALGWLERNRLSDHLDCLDGDARYAWSARQRRGRWPPERAARR